MNKKGISLVALVITIIVLIILTGAVIMTGINTPAGASTAVANSNLATVQDAVTIYIMNQIATQASQNPPVYTTVAAVVATMVTNDVIDSTKVSAATLGLNMDDADLDQYTIDSTGLVELAPVP